MTSEHTPPTDAMHKIARACTDPLWIQHRFLATGHGETTDNGTATFIKFEGRHYLCTCAHVVEAATGDNVPALMIDRIVLTVPIIKKAHRENPSTGIFFGFLTGSGLTLRLRRSNSIGTLSVLKRANQRSIWTLGKAHRGSKTGAISPLDIQRNTNMALRKS
jgi:hypothetical protein